MSLIELVSDTMDLEDAVHDKVGENICDGVRISCV